MIAQFELHFRQLHVIVKALAIIEDIISSCNTQEILHDEDLQSSLIQELTTIIGRINAFDYDSDDLDFVYHALFTKAKAFTARFCITRELHDIDESISLLKTITHFPDSNPSVLASVTFTLAELRYDHTQNVDDLDNLIESEETLLRFEDFCTYRGFRKLALHLLIRFKIKHEVDDAERSLSLSNEIYPLSVNSDDLVWSRIRMLSITGLSHMGRRFSDISQVFKRVQEGALISSQNLESIHALYYFLAKQFKFAALDSNLSQMREIEQIIYSHPEHTKWKFPIFNYATEAELNESIALLSLMITHQG
ncbi:hypothetical protein NLI96_g11236 [Meripilus lineatus]|uniref:Uncharacterized protein n=1 Tax=Meripilus lineatus TaxID=2056292 RepID=A0AAD5UWC4_9APHY|nr:hypothetical protein NLI96_g11236 [Physisporinus lineatus]